MKKNIYLAVTVLTPIIPVLYLVRFFVDNGLDIGLLLEQMTMNDVSLSFTIDTFLCIAVVLVFIIVENKKYKIKYSWVPVVTGFFLGIAYMLALFLYLREVSLEKRERFNEDMIA